MNEQYKYPVLRLLLASPHGNFLILFVAMTIIYLKYSSIHIAYICLAFSIFLALTLIELSTIKYAIKDEGLIYTTWRKTVALQWNDIQTIKKRYLWSGGFPFYGKPKDIEIRCKNKRYMIYYVIKGIGTNMSINDLTQRLIAHTKLQIDEESFQLSNRINGRKVIYLLLALLAVIILYQIQN